MLLHREMTENSTQSIYFTLPNQDDYLYEYDGDLDEALEALPEIYETVGDRGASLTPQAAIVIEQLWDYFDRTGEQVLEGQYEYNFQVEGDTLLILPKDNSGEIAAVDREGQVESTFQPERFEHLMERFDNAYQQLQVAEQQNKEQGFELG